MHKAVRYLLYSQASFLFFICFCIALEPNSFLHNAPASYYGTLARTILPYAAGMLSAVYFLFKAWQGLDDRPKLRVIKASIGIIALLMLGLLVIPYSVNALFFDIHRILAIALLVIVLVVSIYIVGFVDRRPRNLLIISFELIATALLVLSQASHVIALAGLGELLLNLAFTLLICNTVHDLLSKPAADLK